MSKRPSQAESDDKGAGNADTPMGRFKGIARQVVSVPKEKIQEAQRKHEAERPKQKKTRPSD